MAGARLRTVDNLVLLWSHRFRNRFTSLVILGINPRLNDNDLRASSGLRDPFG
jgi:hypothetical protein